MSGHSGRLGVSTSTPEHRLAGRPLDVKVEAPNVSVTVVVPQRRLDIVLSVVKILLLLALVLLSAHRAHGQTNGSARVGLGFQPPPYLAANLPTSASVGELATVTDGASATDCSGGGGSTVVTCKWNGSAWTALGGSGGGGTPGGSNTQLQYNASGSFGGATVGTYVVGSTQFNFQGGTHFQFLDPSDTSKIVQIDASGITAGNTRTVKIADAASSTAQALAAVSHKFVTAFSQTTGAFTLTQPVCGDLSDSGTLCTSSAALPANTTATASNWFSAYNSTTGAFTKSQPAFSDISGTITAGQLPATAVTGSGLTANNMLAGNGSATVKLADGNGATYAEGTLTTSNPFISHTATFNAGGVVFHNFVSNVTNTASAAGSMLLELQKAGVNQFSVDVLGNATALLSLQTTATAPATTAGTAGAWTCAEGTAFTNVSGTAGIYCDSTLHEFGAKTNGASSAGMLARIQPGSIASGDKTGAITTATLCAASAGACNVAGNYTVEWAFIQTGTACTTNTTGGVTFLLTWTDRNGTAHSAISLAMDDSQSLTGTSGTFHFNTTGNGLGTAWAAGEFHISTNGSVIQYATGFTQCSVAGTGTYQLDAWVTRKQ